MSHSNGATSLGTISCGNGSSGLAAQLTLRAAAGTKRRVSMVIGTRVGWSQP